ncbi:MAG: hypothetical protein QOF96_3573 [Actinomycetota bacterium]|nr:hypothetical protein [Actinomycetota bacterium]
MALAVKLPGPDHPITLEANPARILVRARGQVIADTTSALTMREAAYPPVHYIPLADVDQTLLRRSPTQTYCPYKGEASYYSISITQSDGPDDITVAVWTYETPYPAVEAIASHVAFYPDRVEIVIDDHIAP